MLIDQSHSLNNMGMIEKGAGCGLLDCDPQPHPFSKNRIGHGPPHGLIAIAHNRH